MKPFVVEAEVLEDWKDSIEAGRLGMDAPGRGLYIRYSTRF